MSRPHTEKTSTGLDANLAAALTYLVGFITGVVFLLVERDNKFVRFHAMQSTLVFAGIVLIDIVLQMMVPILGFLVVVFVVLPGSVFLWLLLMFKAYQGEDFKLPLVGQMAADRS